MEYTSMINTPCLFIPWKQWALQTSPWGLLCSPKHVLHQKPEELALFISKFVQYPKKSILVTPQEELALLISKLSKLVQYPKNIEKTILVQICMWCQENRYGEFHGLRTAWARWVCATPCLNIRQHIPQRPSWCFTPVTISIKFGGCHWT